MAAAPPWRATAQREALLALGRTLTGRRGGAGGVLSEALEIVLRGLGATRGAAFEVGASLELVTHRAMPSELRAVIERLDRPEPEREAWFPAQTAVKTKKLVFEPQLYKRVEGHVPDKVLLANGWVAGAALPVVVAREVRAVLLMAAPSGATFVDEALAFLETAGHMLSLALAGEANAATSTRDRVEVQTHVAQMVTLGALAATFSNELAGPIAALELILADQERAIGDVEGALLSGESARDRLLALHDLGFEGRSTLSRLRASAERLTTVVRCAPGEALDLDRVVRDAAAIVGGELRLRGVELEVRAEEGCIVTGRRDELVQLTAQLLRNAGDAAVSGSGSVASPLREIEVEGARRPPRVTVSVGVRDARVVICVEDSGPGIPPTTRPRLFEPFFTTKSGRSGLGLTLVKHAALAHRGHVELATSALGGALFRVVLPLDAAARERLRSREPTGQPANDVRRRSAARVLWIDDDEMFVRSVRRALSDRTVTIATTSAAAEAALFTTPEHTPDIVFCDIGLPDRSGHELHAAVRARRPDLAAKFVFVTGGVVSEELADYLIASGRPALLKPVKLDEVRALIEGRDLGDNAFSTAPTLLDTPTTRPSKRQIYTGVPGSDPRLAAPRVPRIDPRAEPEELSPPRNDVVRRR